MRDRIEKINLTGNELRAICKEYEYDRQAHFLDENDDVRAHLIKKAMTTLDKADYVIFCLYMEYGSERKVANLLGCSRTPLHNCITKIKDKIKEEIKKYDAN